MGIRYRKASIEDMEILVRARMKVLRSANGLSDDADLSEVEKRSYAYYQKALREDLHTAYLALDGEQVAGTGGVSYYCVMPTCHNPSGEKAYIMNVYTDPAYRRQGIAYEILRLLVADAQERGVQFISLEATAMGRPLYEKFGFTAMRDEMWLER